jgi:hypothetical protein
MAATILDPLGNERSAFMAWLYSAVAYAASLLRWTPIRPKIDMVDQRLAAKIIDLITFESTVREIAVLETRMTAPNASDCAHGRVPFRYN